MTQTEATTEAYFTICTCCGQLSPDQDYSCPGGNPKGGTDPTPSVLGWHQWFVGTPQAWWEFCRVLPT